MYATDRHRFGRQRRAQAERLFSPDFTCALHVNCHSIAAVVACLPDCLYPAFRLVSAFCRASERRLRHAFSGVGLGSRVESLSDCTPRPRGEGTDMTVGGGAGTRER